MKTTWNLLEAVELCKKIESVCPDYGCHVGLTGGCLYKEGERKDCDLVFYRIRQAKEINWDGLIKKLEEINILLVSRHSWVLKMKFHDKIFDCLDTSISDGDYAQ